MKANLIASAITAAVAAALLPATTMAAPRDLTRYYSIGCAIGTLKFSVRNTTPHPIPAGTPIWVRILHKSGAVQARTVSPVKTIAPGASDQLGATIGSARSCTAAVVLRPHVQSAIQRRPMLGRPLIEERKHFGNPLIEKGPKRI